MQKVSYGVREVLLGEITKTSRAVAAKGECWGRPRGSFSSTRKVLRRV
jgi:hypothetical protein